MEIRTDPLFHPVQYPQFYKLLEDEREKYEKISNTQCFLYIIPSYFITIYTGFLTVLWAGLRCVIVVFSEHTHLLFWGCRSFHLPVILSIILFFLKLNLTNWYNFTIFVYGLILTRS